MPDYNTRLRTHSLILPPRRLRPSPSPPPSRTRSATSRSKPSPSGSLSPVPPQFPPPHAVLHPDDAANKTLLAIGRALLAVDNRALTIKDLSQLSLDHGLFCQNASAASQAITTFIRSHLSRCQREHAPPLLLSLALSGTPADDRLAPALHSRSGGTTATAYDPHRSLTSFRRGTTVWYLSETAGAPCPFRRAGLELPEALVPIAPAAPAKRKRIARDLPARKLPAAASEGPAMATRNRVHAASCTPASTSPPRPPLRVKLTLTVSDPSPSHSSSPLLSESDSESESDLSELDSDSATDSPASPPVSNGSGDFESVIQLVHSPPPVNAQQLPPYPILAPAIPSPTCTTPTTALVSPSVHGPDPFALTSALSPTHLIRSSFSSFRTALSNPPHDHRARSSSLPFSAASPPPDSEDEDEDFHNSMVGLRRGSAPLPFKREDEDIIPKDEPSPIPIRIPSKNVDGIVDGDHRVPGQSQSSEGVSTPLEVLPGFVSLTHEDNHNHDSESDSHLPVKDEPTSAVLPPHGPWSVKLEKPNPDEHGHVLLDPEHTPRHRDALAKGVSLDVVVGDVELLGPESVRSRDWDAAWGSLDGREEDAMDVDLVEPSPLSCHGGSVSPVSPSETLATTISSPPSDQFMPVDVDSDAPFLVHPLHSCDPPIVATVIRGVPVYRTFLAPGLSLLRRIDNSFVNVTPLMTYLDLPLSALVSHTHVTPRMSVSRAPEPFGGTWVPLSVAQSVARHATAGKSPSEVLDVFLSADLGLRFPDALARLTDPIPVVVRDVGIRVEDVFVGAEYTEPKQDVRVRSDVVELQPPAIRLSSGCLSRTSSQYAPIALPVPLNEQEETLFYSIVDIFGCDVPATPAATKPGTITTTCTPLSSSPVLSAAKPPPPSMAVLPVTASTNEKENAVTARQMSPSPSQQPVVRRKREKAVVVADLPVRRSKRTLVAKKNAVPVTRSRARARAIT